VTVNCSLFAFVVVVTEQVPSAPVVQVETRRLFQEPVTVAEETGAPAESRTVAVTVAVQLRGMGTANASRSAICMVLATVPEGRKAAR
jgi:hypothetical protein